MQFESLEILSANKLGKNAKSTIHASGKMSFSRGAEELMELYKGGGIIFAKSPQEEGYQSLFCTVSTKSDEAAFPLTRSGSYYQVNIRNLLDLLGVNYRQRSVVYDVSAEKSNSGRKIFKLTAQRENSRSTKSKK